MINKNLLMKTKTCFCPKNTDCGLIPILVDDVNMHRVLSTVLLKHMMNRRWQSL